MPTLCEAMGIDVPAQCDGFPLDAVPARRGAAAVADGGPLGVRLARPGDRHAPRTSGRGTAPSNASTSPCIATTSYAYVQFGDGSWRCFDIAADPTWRTEVDRSGDVVLPLAQAMLTWRSRHADRTLADLVLGPDGGGRWPPMPVGWGAAP